MPYEPIDRDHEAPEDTRAYDTPEDPAETFYQACIDHCERVDWYWADRDQDTLYAELADTLDGMDTAVPLVDAATYLELTDTDDRYAGMYGLALSAVHNTADDPVLCLGLPQREQGNPDASRVGYRLQADRTLVNDGHTGTAGGDASGCFVHRGTTELLGWYADGVVYNLGTVESEASNQNAGIAVNTGTIDSNFAPENSGIAVNFGQVNGSFGDRTTGICINYGTVSGRTWISTGSDGFVVDYGTMAGNDETDPDHGYFALDPGDDASDRTDREQELHKVFQPDGRFATYLQEWQERFEQAPHELRDTVQSLEAPPRTLIETDIHALLEPLEE